MTNDEMLDKTNHNEQGHSTSLQTRCRKQLDQLHHVYVSDRLAFSAVEDF